jgi:hypothetical protein
MPADSLKRVEGELLKVCEPYRARPRDHKSASISMLCLETAKSAMRSSSLGEGAAKMQYEIRIENPDGSRAMTWNVERKDDMSALNFALEACEHQKVELWEGQRRIACISLSGQPRLTL